MMKIRVFVLMLLAPIAVQADDLDPVVYDLKVDLDDVVAVGEVKPVDGVTSSALPNKDALRVFSENGYSAVIDLRGPGEKSDFDEKAAVEELGMSYVSLPVENAQAVTFENASKLNELIDTYPGPVLIHCASGNRVGALMALRQSLDGASDDIALAVGRQAGLTSLEPVVLERLAERKSDR